MQNGPLKPGEVFVGDGGNLLSRQIIHACVPIYGTEQGLENIMLREWYDNVLAKAE